MKRAIGATGGNPDRALPMRQEQDVRYPTDEHGCTLCPLCNPADLGGSDCGWRGLFLVWESDVPLMAGTERIGRPEEAGRASTTDAWRVECPSGHVLAVSSGEETAEPFDRSVLP